MEAWEWLAKVIAGIRFDIEDRDDLTDYQWGICVDEACSALEREDAPEAIRAVPGSLPT